MNGKPRSIYEAGSKYTVEKLQQASELLVRNLPMGGRATYQQRSLFLLKPNP
jgi:hypothetical protein